MPAAPLRVLELSDSAGAAAFCGRRFQQEGAEVTRVEAGLDEARAPALELFLHHGKHRVQLDYRDEGQLESLRELARASDVVVTDAPARDCERWQLLRLGGEDTLHTSVTPFGLSGPYRDYEATESILLALGGMTYLNGFPDRPPVTMPGRHASYVAGTIAHIATHAALRTAGESAAPSLVEVSVHECLSLLHQMTDLLLSYRGIEMRRTGNQHISIPATLAEIEGRWYSLNFGHRFWQPVPYLLGQPELLDDPTLQTNADRIERVGELIALMAGTFRGRAPREIVEEAQGTWRVPVAYVMSLAEILDDPHLRDRGLWQPLSEATGPDGEPLRAPGLPAIVTRNTNTASPKQLATPRRAPATRPLEGLRVLDLTHVWSGPLATRFLGDLGADVIRVEAPGARGAVDAPAGLYHADGIAGDHPWNRDGLLNKFIRNKRSLALDLKTEVGRDIFLRLVAVSDVVVENFSARAMERLGLGTETLWASNPALIYLAMPAFGGTGPYRDFIGNGLSVEVTTGLPALMGDDDEPLTTARALPDALAGTTALSLLMSALARRELTGAGEHIDLSQQESAITFLGEEFIQRQLSGREPSRLGNRHAEYAPHGIYPCRGEDDWIAIAVRNERDWRALCKVAGLSEHAARYPDVAARHANADAIDSAIEGWTSCRDKRDAMAALQEAGVPAGAVLRPSEWMADPHLLARDAFVSIDETEVGPRTYDSLPLRLGDQQDRSWWTPAPTLGEHNHAVLSEVLGMDDEAITSLERARVIAQRPPG